MSLRLRFDDYLNFPVDKWKNIRIHENQKYVDIIVKTAIRKLGLNFLFLYTIVLSVPD